MGTVDGEAEWGLVAQMRTFVESQDPSAKVPPPLFLSKFFLSFFSLFCDFRWIE